MVIEQAVSAASTLLFSDGYTSRVSTLAVTHCYTMGVSEGVDEYSAEAARLAERDMQLQNLIAATARPQPTADGRLLEQERNCSTALRQQLALTKQDVAGHYERAELARSALMRQTQQLESLLHLADIPAPDSFDMHSRCEVLLHRMSQIKVCYQAASGAFLCLCCLQKTKSRNMLVVQNAEAMACVFCDAYEDR